MNRVLLTFLLLSAASFLRAGDASMDLVAEMNLARTQPQVYAEIVAARAPRLRCRPEAIEEAVRFLKRQRPVGPLVCSPGLSQSAMAHVIDTGSRGLVGHRGSDGSNVATRVSRFGQWDGRVAENIMYGPIGIRDAIVALIVDDGVPDRYHRINMFERSFRFAGGATGSHPGYGTMYVTDFAASYREARGRQTAGL